MERTYLPVLLLLGFVIANAVLMLGVSHLTMRSRPTPEKQTPYESGMPPLGDAREVERGNVPPERLVSRQRRAQGEKERHDQGEAQEDGEAPARLGEDDEPGNGQPEQQPAEVDELLAPRFVPAIEEVDRLRRVAP